MELNSGLLICLNQHRLHEKGSSFSTFLCYTYNSSLYNYIDKSRYFFFSGVVLPLSTKHLFCANCVPSLFLWEIPFYNSIAYYDFYTFVQRIYNLEAVSPEFCYNIVPVTLSGGKFRKPSSKWPWQWELFIISPNRKAQNRTALREFLCQPNNIIEEWSPSIFISLCHPRRSDLAAPWTFQVPHINYIP